MTKRIGLAGLLASSAALTLCMAGGANAVTREHHHHARRVKPEDSLRGEVSALKAEVESLQARLDAQARAQQQAQAQAQTQIDTVQAQVQAAQGAAQAAQSQVAAQQNQIETIPAEVETAAAKHAPATGWWNNTKVGATVYGDMSYISNKNDGVKNAQSGEDYDIKRAYISIDHKFNDVFAANITTDVTYDSTTKATQLYIKKAYLQAHLSDAFTVRAGSADLPWIPFVENIYGYRYVEHVLPDAYGFGTSADWGVHVLGDVWDHHLGYAVSVVDGAGYKIPAIGTANRTDYMDVEGRVNANFDNFTVAVGGYEGKLGKAVTDVPTFHTAERFDALAAYTSSRLRLGAEYLWARYYSDVLQPNQALTNSAEGVSLFGSWFFTSKFSVFGRYDYLKPKEDTQPSFHSNYYNVGLSYKPIGPIDIALVYKHDSVVDGLLSTQNGVIGTLNSNNIGKGEYDEIGVFTQMKF